MREVKPFIVSIRTILNYLFFTEIAASIWCNTRRPPWRSLHCTAS